MSDFNTVKSYEPSIRRAGFMPVEDSGTRVTMVPFDALEGSFIRTVDYKLLLDAYNALAFTVVMPDQEQTETKKNKKNRA